MSNLAQEMNGKIQNAGKDAVKATRDEAQSVVGQISEFSRNATKQAGALASDISGSASEYYDASRDYVKKNPMTGVAIAAAAGILTGSLLTMMFRQRD